MSATPALRTHCPRCKKTWLVLVVVLPKEPWEADQDPDALEETMLSCARCGGETTVLEATPAMRQVNGLLDEMREEQR